MKDKLSKVRKHALAILMGFILISVILTSNSLYKNKLPSFATPDELIPSLLQNKTIRLADLVREDFTIRNRTFDNCHIYGPAVIFFTGGIFIDNVLKRIDITNIDANFIETTNTGVLGVIVFDNCVIKKCTFYNISFIGNSERIAKIKAGFSNSPK